MNPFKFGKPVEGEYYLPRPELCRAVANFLQGGMSVALIGPRRFGKTSFLLELLKYREETHQCASVLVDVFNITSHRDFLRQLVNAVKKKRSLGARLIEWARKLRSPVFSWQHEDAGTFSVRFETAEAEAVDVKQLILEMLDSLETIAPNLCIAFDEFQSVARLEDEGWLEATLRTKMQAQKGVSYIFSGSRRGVIHDMFNNPARPFYRSCQLIDFPSFGPEFCPWIVERFGKAKVACSLTDARRIMQQVDDTPNYVQMVGYHIVAEGYRKVTQEIISETLVTIVFQNAYAYQTLLNSLSPVQQRVLRLAANERESVFSRDLVQKYEIKSPSHVAHAINALKEKQILDEDTRKGRVVFDDPLFALWLGRTFVE